MTPYYPMRRKNQALTIQEAKALLENGTAGVLALCGHDKIPYAVCMNYVFTNNTLYFHSAKEGHKIDLIRQNPNASFCVTAGQEILKEAYTTRYTSVVVFGRMRILEDEEEKRNAIKTLCLKYHPTDTEQHRSAVIANAWDKLLLLALDPAYITAKRSGR